MELLVEDAPATRVADAPVSEGEACSLENYLTLPDHTMDERIAAARKQLGNSTILLGHHYQRDEVIRFADYTGDSYKLSKIAAQHGCELHCLLRRALHGGERRCAGRDGQQVILPDLNAGCSMADMAEISAGGGLLGIAGACRAWRGQSHSADLYEFDRGDQGFLRGARRAGLHLVQCSARRSTGRLRGGKRSCFCRTSTWAAIPRMRWAFRWSEMVVWDPWQINGGDAGPAARGEGDLCGRGTARCISGFCRAMWMGCARSIPGSR